MATLSLLDREMFAEAEAARLLQLPQGTLHYWLEGGTQRGKVYKPIIRIEPTGSRTVTWAEFVEAGLLRSYRSRRVPMAELRAFIDLLRQQYGVPYPLAHEEPFVSGKQLVFRAQEEAGLDGEFYLVAVANNQLILTAPSVDFTERVHWENDIVTQWRPHDDPRSPVVMTPDVRFGRPAVNGVSTDVIWEHDEAGEDLAEIADSFGLSQDEVRWANIADSRVRTSWRCSNCPDNRSGRQPDHDGDDHEDPGQGMGTAPRCLGLARGTRKCGFCRRIAGVLPGLRGPARESLG
jgi:uncharacterized protein (DUF433 family)